jgi:hypothetical protein
MQFLSEEWLAAAGDTFGRLSAGPGSSCRLQFEAGDTVWHLVADDGGPVELGPGEVSQPDAQLRWNLDDAQRIWQRDLVDNDALAATTVTAAWAGGEYVGLPSPMDLMGRPELDAVPLVPDATLGVEYIYRNGPFGDVTYVLEFVDGRLVDQRLDTLDDPDVGVDIAYRSMGLVRTGRLSILEAIEHAKVTGRIGPMALLAGISESPEFHAAELATGEHVLALATLGELWAQPGVGEAMAGLTRAEAP